jgi:hypothetical protein
MTGLPQRGNPEAVSGASQCEGEYAKCNGGECDQSPVIFLGKIARTSSAQSNARDLTFERTAENTVTFIKSVILVIGLVLMYAFGKRLGLVDKESYSNNRHSPK